MNSEAFDTIDVDGFSVGLDRLKNYNSYLRSRDSYFRTHVGGVPRFTVAVSLFPMAPEPEEELL